VVPPTPRRVCVDDAAPPSPDAQGYCGNMFITATAERPNLYFVIDRSGSMLDVVDGQEKFGAVANAVIGLVRSLGPQANIGAALFPGYAVSEMNPCAVGDEVFPTQPGDALPSGSCGDGPVTKGFATAVRSSGGVFGATPTAASLTALIPTLSRLPGKTAVILATDGGPNCNSRATCDSSSCIPNIENQCPSNIVNCCTPEAFGVEACLDGEPTRDAVAAIYQHGIPTYVIGIPGSSPYSALLDQLALAGGTARPTHPAYYDVAHLDELDGILATIGAKVVLSCHLKLDSAPPKRGLVNVYLDRELLTYGAVDGWVWSDDLDGGFGAAAADGAASELDADQPNEAAPSDSDSMEPATPNDAADSALAIDVVGAACDKLSSGQVQQVQIVFGCPTAVIR